MSQDDYNRLADSAVLIKDFLLKHSAPLVKPTRKNKKNVVRYLLNFPRMLKKHGFGVILLLILGNF